MHKGFWLDKWRRGDTGFHQKSINPHLKNHWPKLRLAKGSTVFVPLCGKSDDIFWLKQQGFNVLGVDICSIAIEAFFRHHRLAYRKTVQGKFACYQADNIQLLSGDLFLLSAQELQQVNAMYDRVAFTALPADMRQQYARHLGDILPTHVKSLLISQSYPQHEMDGPPFSVEPPQVKSCFCKYARITLLQTKNTLAENPALKQQGLTQLQEQVYAMDYY